MKQKKKYIDLGLRGRLNIKNKLNELTGKEWIKFSKSWFIHQPVKRKESEMLHPAKYPESLVAEFISFFTKKNAWVLDPFAGTGSTLIAASDCNRNSVGVELNKKYFNITQRRLTKLESSNKFLIIKGNSLDLPKLLKENKIDKIQFDYAITSPPYWNQLVKNNLRQVSRKQKGLDTVYSKKLNSDLGNIKDYDDFLEQQAVIFDNVYDVLKPEAYLTIITNNVYANGKLFPLAYDTATSLTKRGKKSWVLKDEKIWLQNDKRLIALGVNNAWVGNRHHQYCLIFRKEV